MVRSLWGWQDVIKAVFMEKVTVVATYNNRSIRSAHMEVKLPSVIALKDFVNHHRTRPAFTRRNLFLRDEHKCQYCLKYFPPHDLSFDHVLPKKLGGKGTWENVVTACGRYLCARARVCVCVCVCVSSSMHVSVSERGGTVCYCECFV